MKRALLALIAAAFLAGPAHALLPGEQLSDPKLEARARTIGGRLRCLVCQNESIEESDAALAGDLRVLLRQRLQAGDTDQQATDFLVQRYGHYVLLTPPFEGQTLILWLGPALLLAGGGVWVALMARQRGAAPTETVVALTPEEEAKLADRLRAPGSVAAGPGAP